jgi:hypothetical protein
MTAWNQKEHRSSLDRGLMPRGPKAECRPADVIGNAVHVMKVLMDEAEEELTNPGLRRTRPPPN